MQITKAKIMYEHLLTNTTVTALQNESPEYLNLQPLNIYREIIACLSEDDFKIIQEKSIYLNVLFGPASTSHIKVALPIGAKIITFDFNHLSKCELSERIAIILHEYGHAFNPTLKGNGGEFAADDFAIERGYGKALKNSLEKSIIENPIQFDKDLSRLRINRIAD
jgi:hypothetical protein